MYDLRSGDLVHNLKGTYCNQLAAPTLDIYKQHYFDSCVDIIVSFLYILLSFFKEYHRLNYLFGSEILSSLSVYL